MGINVTMLFQGIGENCQSDDVYFQDYKLKHVSEVINITTSDKQFISRNNKSIGNKSKLEKNLLSVVEYAK